MGRVIALAADVVEAVAAMVKVVGDGASPPPLALVRVTVEASVADRATMLPNTSVVLT